MTRATGQPYGTTTYIVSIEQSMGPFMGCPVNNPGTPHERFRFMECVMVLIPLAPTMGNTIAFSVERAMGDYGLFPVPWKHFFVC